MESQELTSPAARGRGLKLTDYVEDTLVTKSPRRARAWIETMRAMQGHLVVASPAARGRGLKREELVDGVGAL